MKAVYALQSCVICILARRIIIMKLQSPTKTTLEDLFGCSDDEDDSPSQAQGSTKTPMP